MLFFNIKDDWVTVQWNSDCRANIAGGNLEIVMKPLNVIDITTKFICDQFTRENDFAEYFGVPTGCEFEILITFEGKKFKKKKI